MPENFAKTGRLRFALRETHAIASNPRLLAAFAIVVAVFTVTGPFGTLERYSPPERLAYWLVSQAVSWLLAIFGIVVADAALAGRIASKWLRIAVTGALAGLPVAAASLAFNALSRPDDFDGGLDGGAGFVWRTLSTSLILTIAFSALSSLVMTAGDQKEAAPAERPTGAPEPAAAATSGMEATLALPPLIGKLPLEKRGRLISLSAQDHYVEIVTAKGRALVLMRLADAMEHTAPEAGMAVHRSHWVAFSAVERVERRGSQAFVILAGGGRLPVSRNRVTKLLAATAKAG